MKKYILVAILFGAAGSALAVQQFLVKKTYFPGKQNQSSGNFSESKTINYGDDRILLGDSHNAFVGKILSTIGSRVLAGSSGPSSQYRTEIILNIKGSLNDAVTVNQFEAGIDASRRPLLQIGATYVFATRYVPDEDLYVIVYYPYQYQLLTNDSSLTDERLKVLAEGSDRVKALRAAYPKEQLIYFDAANNKAYNSYASRHFDTSGQLIDDTVVLHRQYLSAHPEAAAQYAEPNESVAPANESAPTASEQPAAKPETSIASTPTPGESVAPTETPVPTEATGTPAPTEEPTPIPTDTPVQS